MTQPLLRLAGITKIYPGVVANHGVNLTVMPGEIHALLGENGAGKSTLMNILYGMATPDAGHIYWKERPAHIDSPRTAARLGIGMVHQQVMLIPVFTALENIILSAQRGSGFWLRRKEIARSIQVSVDAFGLDIDLNRRIESMSPGMRQRVEIVKALHRGAALLILDEPTAVLTPGEVENLFLILRRLVANGQAVIFISHKLDEVMAISDRVTVLRNGRTITTLETGATNERALAELMVGHAVTLDSDKLPPAIPGDPIIQLADVEAKSLEGLEGRDQLRGVSLTVHAGEIVGVAGVDGNGQQALLDVLCGVRHPSRGQITIQGADITRMSPRAIRRAVQLGCIPGDRQTRGLVLNMTVRDNLILQQVDAPPLSWGGFLRHRRIKSYARELAQRFDIRSTGVTIPVRNLSGGNQQKVILARELGENPPALIAANPTSGLDVGAAEYVYQQLIEHRQGGAAILLISSDLEEILWLSDRIAVLHNGEIMGIVPGDQAERTRIGLMMAGTRLADLARGA